MLKKNPPPAGAPDWVLTYGDLMSLLLCFFILLAAMANFDKQDKRMQTAIESIRQALGATAQVGAAPDQTLDFNSLLKQLEEILRNAPHERTNSDAPDDAIPGAEMRVRRINDGLEVTVGGTIAFDRFETKVSAAAEPLLATLVEKVRGHRNKIEVRGHAAQEPLPPNSPYRDVVELSFARAKATRDRLVDLGVEADRIRVVAVGPFEPIVRKAYSDEARAQNHRVDIRVLEVHVEEYANAAAPADAPK